MVSFLRDDLPVRRRQRDTLVCVCVRARVRVRLRLCTHVLNPSVSVRRRIFRGGFTEFISGVIRANFCAGPPPPLGQQQVSLQS